MTRREIPLRAVIFDLDGTLVDSRLDFAAMRSELGAPAGVGLLEFIDALSSSEARQEAMSVIDRHELAGARGATWMPGARQALDALCRRGVRTAIVTRNSRRAAQLTMERLRMPTIPLRAREDAAPKPNPEALLSLATEWAFAPEYCAYIGDFRYDIEAAERAGMRPVLYCASGQVPEEHVGRVQVLTDFLSILDWPTQP